MFTFDVSLFVGLMYKLLELHMSVRTVELIKWNDIEINKVIPYCIIRVL